MSRTTRKHVRTGLPQPVIDLVAEGGYPLPSDDTASSPAEEANSTQPNCPSPQSSQEQLKGRLAD